MLRIRIGVRPPMCRTSSRPASISLNAVVRLKALKAQNCLMETANGFAFGALLAVA